MKNILLLLVAITFTSAASGQIIKSIGIKGGLSRSNQSWNYNSVRVNPVKESRNGLYTALAVEFVDVTYFSLTTDFGYSVKGSTDNVMLTGPDYPEGNGSFRRFDTRFEYLTVSPMVKAKYPLAQFVPYALIGVRLDYQLSYSSEMDYSLIEKDFNKTMVGANLGTGMEYKVNQFGIFLEGIYQYDFTKLMDTAPSATTSGIEIKNSALVICLGVKYNLQK